MYVNEQQLHLVVQILETYIALIGATPKTRYQVNGQEQEMVKPFN